MALWSSTSRGDFVELPILTWHSELATILRRQIGYPHVRLCYFLATDEERETRRPEVPLSAQLRVRSVEVPDEDRAAVLEHLGVTAQEAEGLRVWLVMPIR